MKKHDQTLEELLSKLTSIETDWRDKYSDEII